jgi:PAS domain-containing protein
MKKQMDDSFGETMERYRALFEERQEALAILTPEAQVVDVNQGLARSVWL